MAFLWLNAMGCGLVMFISTVLEFILRITAQKK